MNFRKLFLRYLPMLIGVFLVSPFLYYLFKLYLYIPGFDETYQIEAGIRIARGLGNTYSWTLGKDLALPYFSFQNAWPIGYSFFLSILVFIGFPLTIALKVFKSLVILLSIYLWIRFANNFLYDIYSRIVFACLITAHVILCSVSVTDMMIIMLVPLFSGVAFRLSHREHFPNYDRLKIFVNPFALGLVVALIIFIKYSGLFLFISGLLWICLLNYQTLKRGLVYLIKFSVPICSVILTISIINLLYTSNINSVTTKGLIFKTPFLYPNWLQDIGNAVFSATHIGKILEKSPINIGLKVDSIIFFLKISIFITFLLALIALFRSGGVKRLLANWIVINFLAAAFFLKLVTIFYFSDPQDWTPVKEGRFYWALIPLLVLGVLMSIQHLYSSLQTIAKSMVAISFFIFMLLGITYYSNIKYRIYADLDFEIATLFGKVNGIIKKEKSDSIIYFGDPINWQLYPEKGINNFLVGPPVFSSDNYFSKSTTVLMICSSKDYTQLQESGLSRVNPAFEQIARDLKFHTLKSGKNTKIFWKVFPAGYTFK